MTSNLEAPGVLEALRSRSRRKYIGGGGMNSFWVRVLLFLPEGSQVVCVCVCVCLWGGEQKWVSLRIPQASGQKMTLSFAK